MDNRQSIEQQVLGAILTDPMGFHKVSTYLKAEIFTLKHHQEIYTAMAGLYAAHKPIKKEMVRFSLDAEINGVETDTLLSAMVHQAISGDRIPLEEYAEIMSRQWIKEEGQRKLQKMSEYLKKPTCNVEMAFSQIRAELDILSGAGTAVKSISLDKAMESNLKQISARYEGGSATGISTGLKFIDDLTGNWVAGQYIIIGAATKVGKSALAFACALGLALHGAVLYYSFEMSANQLASREMASLTGVSTYRQRSKKIKDEEYEQLSNAKALLTQSPNFHIITESMNIDQIIAHARTEKNKYGHLVAIVVDHLGLINPIKGSGGKDWEIAMESSPKLKKAAEELNCVVIGLSQLKKEDSWGRNLKEKMLSCKKIPNADDLKGSIANDADHVITISREAALLAKIQPVKETEDYYVWKAQFDLVSDKAQIRLALSRDAEWPKTVQTYWAGAKTKFEDMEQSINSQAYEEDLF